MTTQDYREKSPLMIFLSYFKNHRWLFAADVTCAVGIAAIDLLFARLAEADAGTEPKGSVSTILRPKIVVKNSVRWL